MDWDSAQSKLRQSIATAAAVIVCACLLISCFAAVSPDIHAYFHCHSSDNFNGAAHECHKHSQTFNDVETGAETDGHPAREKEHKNEVECLACFLALAGSVPFEQAETMVLERVNWLKSDSEYADEPLLPRTDALQSDRGPPVV